MAAISAPSAALVTAAATAKTASDAAASLSVFPARAANNNPSTEAEVITKLQATVTAQLAAITALSTEIGTL